MTEIVMHRIRLLGGIWGGWKMGPAPDYGLASIQMAEETTFAPKAELSDNATPPSTKPEAVSDAQVERAAEALYVEDDVWSAALPWEKLQTSQADQYLRLARAALTAALSTEEGDHGAP